MLEYSLTGRTCLGPLAQLEINGALISDCFPNGHLQDRQVDD